MHEDPGRNLSTSRAKLGLDVRGYIIIVSHVMKLQTRELVLQLAYYQVVRIHVVLVAISLVIDLIDDHQ